MIALARTLSGAALAIGLAGAALAQATHQDHGSGRMPGMGAAARPKPTDSASTKDFKEADKAMMKNMHVAYTGDPDIDFRTHMIPHHQGAIDMAKVALKHAKDSETKTMAENIIRDQEREIAEMQAWLKKHGH